MSSLLVEIQTEELPPKALRTISDAFANQTADALKARGFLSPDSMATAFGSPRRIAVHITKVLAQSPDKPFKQRLVPAKVGLDAQGKATQALTKKLAALGIKAEPKDLTVVNDGKQDQLFYEGVKPGEKLHDVLQDVLKEAVSKLPIPKVMNYQLEDGSTVQFVRPVKKLVALLDNDVVDIELFGLKSGRETISHRFHSKEPLKIPHADKYLDTIHKDKVIPHFDTRKAKMVEQLKAHAKRLNSELIMPEDLVEEVTALTEWPIVYESEFDKEFLTVPEECLLSTMQQNQKYFALRDKDGKLTNKFLVVSHLEAKDGGKAISEGNARVVRARLADAKFFYEQDKQTTLDSRTEGLSNVVYHNQLGNQLERSKRIQVIAEKIASKIGADPAMAKRAAKLAKADLRTLMVGEFPELQGIMGEYYALNDKEHPLVAKAIKEHYAPRYAGDALPTSEVSLAVALADKMDTLAGLFGIGQVPTGEKDPFALRRHALGVLRMLIEKSLPLSLDDLIAIAFAEEMKIPSVKDASKELKAFFYDRLRVLLKDHGASALEVEAVLAVEPKYLKEIPARLKAVQSFVKLPEAESLAAANKRIENILKKNTEEISPKVNAKAFKEPAETALAKALEEVTEKNKGKFEAGQYEQILLSMAPLKAPVDEFFDKVMVNTEDKDLRLNRLSLLDSLHKSMNQVAKLSCLAH